MGPTLRAGQDTGGGRRSGGHAFSVLLTSGNYVHCGQHRAARTIKDPITQNKENMNWYYAQGDQRQGPISEQELDTLIAAGTVTDNTLVWREGMADWLPLRQARPAGSGAAVPPSGDTPPAGWIRCTATGRYFPPEEIVYIEGKPYSAGAKASVLQDVMQDGILPSGQGSRTGPAWEQRETLGFFPAIWETFKGVLTQPTQTFDNMQREGGVGAPLLYNVILGSVGSIAGVLYQFVFNTGLKAMLPPEVQQAATHQTAFTIGIILGVAIFMPLALILGAFIGSGILHLSLMVCSGAKQPFETTFRTYCYCRGSAGLLQLIPGCGALVGGIWSLVCLCIGISRTHEINTGRAVVAVLLPTVVCCAGIAVVAVSILGAVAAQGAHH